MKENSKNKAKNDSNNLVVNEVETSISSTPDKHTKKGDSFITGGAPGQVFKFEKWGLSYGTDDKSHVASFFLSLTILFILAITLIIGAFVERAWIIEALNLLGTAFVFVAGVAIGTSATKK